MGVKERREREREEIRGKILEAARELFVSDGYEAVSMRRIADRIEYSPTTIYLHFKDKLAVLRELCDTDFARLARVFHKIAKISDPLSRLAETGRAYAEFAFAHPNHYRLMFMTPHPPVDVEGSGIEKGNPEEDAYAFLKNTLEECLAKGLLRPELTDIELLAQTVWAANHGVLSLEIAKCKDEWIDWRSRAERVELMIDAVLRGLVAPGVALPLPRAAKPGKAARPARKRA